MRSVLFLTPFMWSHCRWFAIDADPPFPQEKTPGAAGVGFEQDVRGLVERREVHRLPGPGDLLRVRADVGGRARRKARRGTSRRSRSSPTGPADRRRAHASTHSKMKGAAAARLGKDQTPGRRDALGSYVDRGGTHGLREADVLRPVTDNPGRRQVKAQGRRRRLRHAGPGLRSSLVRANASTTPSGW